MMMPDELSCREVVELISDYLESALPPPARALMAAHLADCPGCDTYLDQIERTITLLRGLAQEPLFPGTREELLRTFRAWKAADLTP